MRTKGPRPIVLRLSVATLNNNNLTYFFVMLRQYLLIQNPWLALHITAKWVWAFEPLIELGRCRQAGDVLLPDYRVYVQIK